MKIKIVYSTPDIKKTTNQFYKHLNIATKKYELEVIPVLNQNEFSLAKIYNEYLDLYKNDPDVIVVFLHDDIVIPKAGWADLLVQHFTSDDWAILGLAGTTTMHKSGQWWSDRTSLSGVVRHGKPGQKTTESVFSPRLPGPVRVASIDGVFMACMPNRVKHQFVEYSKFHFYDVPWSLYNSFNGANVGVIFDIDLIHESPGPMPQTWEDSRQLFLKDCDIKGIELPYRIKPTLEPKKYEPKFRPEKVTAIIPTKGKTDMLIRCIQGLLNSLVKPNIIIADTGSTVEEKSLIRGFIQSYDNIKMVEFDWYNFAKINNQVIKEHIKDGLILLCNNDIELVNDALSLMLETWQSLKKPGTVGARLHYENGKVQHGGILLGQNPSNGSLYLGHWGLNTDYTWQNKTKINVLESVVGNTGAFMLTSLDNWTKYGGLNERYNECFEDVEYNMKLVLDGKQNVVDLRACCIHYESQTRTKSKEKEEREREDMVNIMIPFIKENEKELRKWAIKTN